jgi:hypothetical protein
MPDRFFFPPPYTEFATSGLERTGGAIGRLERAGPRTTKSGLGTSLAQQPRIFRTGLLRRGKIALLGFGGERPLVQWSIGCIGCARRAHRQPTYNPLAALKR